MWLCYVPTHGGSTLSFQEDRCPEVEVSMERPREETNAQTLAWPPLHSHFYQSISGLCPGVSFTELILCWAPAQSGKELKWEGNSKSRVLLFLIPMLLFLLSFEGNSYLGLILLLSILTHLLAIGESSNDFRGIVPLQAITVSTVHLCAFNETVWRTQIVCSRSPSQSVRSRVGCRDTSKHLL